MPFELKFALNSLTEATLDLPVGKSPCPAEAPSPRLPPRWKSISHTSHGYSCPIWECRHCNEWMNWANKSSPMQQDTCPSPSSRNKEAAFPVVIQKGVTPSGIRETCLSPLASFQFGIVTHVLPSPLECSSVPPSSSFDHLFLH